MKKYYLINIFLLILILTSCKPTEKGYQNAYDLAKGKREAVMTDLGVNLPEGALQDVDGAQLKEIDGVKVYLQNQRIIPVKEGSVLPEPYNVAIGKYKMNTNCVAQAAALKEEGYKSFAAKDQEGFFYTIAGSFHTLEEAVKFYQDYSKGKDHVYVGLPSAPVIIFSPK